MGEKRCNKCLRTLPLTGFHRRTDGRSRGATCKECEKARVYAWRKTDNGKASEAETRRRYASTPEGAAKKAEYAQSEAMRAARRKYKASEKGKETQRRSNKTPAARARQARYSKSDKGKESIRRSYMSERGRARLARGVHKRRMAIASAPSTLTAAEWAEIKARAKGRCYYCRKVKPLTMDHVIPLSKGGAHTKENVIPACLSCNASKGNRSVPTKIPQLMLAL